MPGKNKTAATIKITIIIIRYFFILFFVVLSRLSKIVISSVSEKSLLHDNGQFKGFLLSVEMTKPEAGMAEVIITKFYNFGKL